MSLLPSHLQGVLFYTISQSQQSLYKGGVSLSIVLQSTTGVTIDTHIHTCGQFRANKGLNS